MRRWGQGLFAGGGRGERAGLRSARSVPVVQNNCRDSGRASREVRLVHDLANFQRRLKLGRTSYPRHPCWQADEIGRRDRGASVIDRARRELISKIAAGSAGGHPKSLARQVLGKKCRARVIGGAAAGVPGTAR